MMKCIFHTFVRPFFPTMKKLTVALGIFLVYCSELSAQTTYPVNGPADPKHTTYCFTNAILHVDPSTVVDSATLIIRDGIIVDAGKKLATPAGAVVVDVKGK